MGVLISMMGPGSGQVAVAASSVKGDTHSIRPPGPKDGDELKGVMHDFLAHMEKIRPLLLNQSAFLAKDNEAMILTWLGEVRADVRKGKSSAPVRASGYQLTLDEFSQHLADTEEHFRQGHKVYARAMLAATTQLCVACHTQVPREKGVGMLTTLGSRPQGKEHSPEGMLQEAEFRFMTHQYESALALYNHLIRNFSAQEMGVETIDRAVRHKLVILAKVRQDPVYAQESFELDLKNKQLPLVVRQNIADWLVYIKNWRQEKVKLEKMSDQQFSAWAESKLAAAAKSRAVAVSDPQVVNLLRLAGLLYRRLHGGKDLPLQSRYLLLLGRCERYLNDQFFYGLGELFLKQCIRVSGTSDIAKECYRELEDNLQFAFQTTTGVEIPDKVQQELARLRDQVGLSNSKSKAGDKIND